MQKVMSVIAVYSTATKVILSKTRCQKFFTDLYSCPSLTHAKLCDQLGSVQFEVQAQVRHTSFPKYAYRSIITLNIRETIRTT